MKLVTEILRIHRVPVYTAADRDYPPYIVKGGDSRKQSPEYRKLIKLVALHAESTQHTVTVQFGRCNYGGVERELCSCVITPITGG